MTSVPQEQLGVCSRIHLFIDRVQIQSQSLGQSLEQWCWASYMYIYSCIEKKTALKRNNELHNGGIMENESAKMHLWRQRFQCRKPFVEGKYRCCVSWMSQTSKRHHLQHCNPSYSLFALTSSWIWNRFVRFSSWLIKHSEVWVQHRFFFLLICTYTQPQILLQNSSSNLSPPGWRLESEGERRVELLSGPPKIWKQSRLLSDFLYIAAKLLLRQLCVCINFSFPWLTFNFLFGLF